MSATRRAFCELFKRPFHIFGRRKGQVHLFMSSILSSVEGCRYMRILFLDESGDTNLRNVDPEYPVFVLCDIIVDEEHYEKK